MPGSNDNRSSVKIDPPTTNHKWLMMMIMHSISGAHTENNLIGHQQQLTHNYLLNNAFNWTGLHPIWYMRINNHRHVMTNHMSIFVI